MVGALNLGIYGIAQFDALNAIFGGIPLLERAVYVLIGLAGVMLLVGCKCKKCKGMGGSCGCGGSGNCGSHEKNGGMPGNKM